MGIFNFTKGSTDSNENDESIDGEARVIEPIKPNSEAFESHVQNSQVEVASVAEENAAEDNMSRASTGKSGMSEARVDANNVDAKASEGVQSEGTSGDSASGEGAQSEGASSDSASGEGAQSENLSSEDVQSEDASSDSASSDLNKPTAIDSSYVGMQSTKTPTRESIVEPAENRASIAGDIAETSSVKSALNTTTETDSPERELAELNSAKERGKLQSFGDRGSADSESDKVLVTTKATEAALAGADDADDVVEDTDANTDAGAVVASGAADALPTEAANGSAASGMADAKDGANAQGASAANAPDAKDAADTEDATASPTAALKTKSHKKRKSDPEERARHAQHAASRVPQIASQSQPRPITAKSGLVPDIPQKKNHRALKLTGITCGIVLLVLLLIYLAGIVVFMGRFLPHTSFGSHDISLKTNAEVVKIVEDEASSYEISMSGPSGCSFSYSASSEDLGLTIDSDELISDIHDSLPAWKWPYYLTQQSHEVSDLMAVSYDRQTASQALTTAVVEFNQTATPPTNATIAYEEDTKKFVVQEEVLGTQLDQTAVLQEFNAAILSLQSRVKLSQDELVQPTVFSTDEKLIESAALATGMVSAHLTLVMNGQNVGEVDGSDLSQFVTVDENYNVTFNEEGLDAWCSELADGYNTVGSTRTYTRPDGKVVSVSGGDYGWEIDQAALQESLLAGVKEGAEVEIEIPFSTEAATYTSEGERDWGNRYIDVDITEQHVRFYDENGNVFWETDCVSGIPDGTHDTVQGVWSLNNKESPSTLMGYENGKKIYETVVTFWMPFEGNSIGFHDATWQPGFGGTMYRDGYGSHGCVNLSYSDAQTLYGLIQIGDVVVVHS